MELRWPHSFVLDLGKLECLLEMGWLKKLAGYPTSF